MVKKIMFFNNDKREYEGNGHITDKGKQVNRECYLYKTYIYIYIYFILTIIIFTQHYLY